MDKSNRNHFIESKPPSSTRPYIDTAKGAYGSKLPLTNAPVARSKYEPSKNGYVNFEDEEPVMT